MVVRRVRADEATAWRELRLRALREDPDAFASLYEEALALPAEAWTARVARLAEGNGQVMFVAEEDGRLLGMAGAFLDTEDSDLPHLISMWVAPEARGRGAGKRLVDAVAGWARDGGFASIRLFVVRGNATAARLYERCGFRLTGNTIRLARDPSVVDEEMRLQLR